MLRLERSYTPKGTFGILRLPNKEIFWTVECPWLNNTPNVSCIPEGLYQLTKDTYKDRYDNYRILNPPPGRFAIELHRALSARDLKGCIGVGWELGDDWNIVSSEDAFTAFMDGLEGRETELLHIVGYRPSIGETEWNS